VIKIEGKTKALTISAVLLTIAVLSGIAYMAYANASTSDTNSTTYPTWAYNEQFSNVTGPFWGRRGFGDRGRGGGRGDWGPITVSQEYQDNVISIAKNDTDIQNLITEGYNITGVRPIISTTVEADGTVTMKATTAIILLQKDTTGRALVWVDVEQAKVTRIETLTITVVEKT